MSKKLCLIVLFSVYTAFGHVELLHAAPSRGTRIPPNGRVEAGYEYNIMFRRPLDRSYGNLTTRNHFYTVSLGVLGWLSLDGKIGLGDVRQKGGSHLPKIEYNTGFAGGYGFRVKAFENKKYGIRAIIGAQHISVHPQDRSIDDDKYESFLDDWQVCGLVSKDFTYITPYVGVKGSDCEIVYNINKHDKKRRYSKYHIGLVSGLEIYFWDNKARAGVEMRLFDENAISAAVSYLF